MKSLFGITLALGAVGAGAYLMLGGQLPHMPGLSGSRDRNRRRDGSLTKRGAKSFERLWDRALDRQLGPIRKKVSLRGEAESDELKLYIDNDGDLYRQQTTSIIKNLQRKLTKGIYDKSKAEKLWMYLVESGAKKYAKEFGGGTWHKMFSMADRKAVAKAMNEDFLANHADA